MLKWSIPIGTIVEISLKDSTRGVKAGKKKQIEFVMEWF